MRKVAQLLMIELGAGIILPSNIVLGICLAVGGLALWLHDLYKARQQVAASNVPAAELSQPNETWELSRDEKLLAQAVDLKVRWNHGHSDHLGIIEDLRDGKRLTDGACTECGVLRNKVREDRFSHLPNQRDR